jgi:SH3-like domain-containing protein
MLKIKITAILLIATIGSVLFVRSEMPSLAQNQLNNHVGNVFAATEKASIKCNVEAYHKGFASDKPKTTIVRAKPGKDSAIVKTVVTKDEVVYSISGSDGDGWFEISKIQAVSDEEVTLFKGRGWIHSSLLDTSIANADPKLRALPTRKSRVIKKLKADESEARPIACRGDWMKIKSGKTIGWLSPDDQCANPLTTCS